MSGEPLPKRTQGLYAPYKNELLESFLVLNLELIVILCLEKTIY